MNLARASFYLTVTNIGLTCLTALNFLFLATSLGPKQLGVLSILLCIPSIGINLLSFGYSKAAIYYLGRKIYSLETILSNGILICLALEVLLCLNLFMFGHYLVLLFPDIQANFLYLAVVSTPTQILLFYLTEACLAAEMLVLNVVIRAIPPVVYISGCLGATLHGSISAEVAFVFYLLGIVIADLLGLGIVVFQSKQRRLFRPNIQASSSCLRFGGKAQIGELAQYLAIRLDLILVGIWAGIEASGYYSMATRLGETIWSVAYSAQLALSAKVAQDFQASVNQKGKRLERVVRYMATGSFLGGIGILFVGFAIFKLFLPQYQPAFILLLALTPGQVSLAVFLLLTANLIGDGFPALTTKVQLVLFSLSLTFYVALIPFLGALGAGLSTSIAYTMSAFITAVFLSKMYQIKLSSFLLWKKEDYEFVRFSAQYLSRLVAR